MFIRYMSDIHLEFGWMHIMSLEEDKDSVLVLAGDIGVIHNKSLSDTLGRFLVDASVQFRAVIYVLGNHEFYGESLDVVRDQIRTKIATLGLTNVFVLEDQTHVIDDVAFIGSTLWTDYNNNPMDKILGEQALNDFRVIHTGPPTGFDRTIRADDLAKIHNRSRYFIFEEVKKQKQLGNKTVVVVHHGVSYQSVHQRFKGDPYNGSFVSEMSKDIIDAQPNIVIHGHVHNAFDYMIDDTRVLVNPRGYIGHDIENGFDPVARVEI